MTKTISIALAMSALAACMGCGAGVPLAPTEVAPLHVRLPEWPEIEVSANDAPPDFESLVAEVSNAFTDAPAGSAEFAAWTTQQVALHEAILRRTHQTPPYSSQRALLLGLDAALVEHIYRAAVMSLGRSLVAADVAPALEVLATCTEPRDVVPMRAFMARCEALRRYWSDWQTWRNGPVWPSECAPTEAQSEGIEDITDYTSTGTPALLYEASRVPFAIDEAALLAAVEQSMRAHVGAVQMVSRSERERALEATHALRDFGGHTCAMPPSVDARLAHQHPRLWVGAVEAFCPVPFNTEESCRLTVSFLPTSGSDEGLPASISVELVSRAPTHSDWIAAAEQLASAPIDEQATEWAHSRIGILAVQPALGTTLRGYSAEIPSEDVDRALAQVRQTMGACRDLEISIPRGIHARLEVGLRGEVEAVHVDREIVTGPRRSACVEAALRTLHFPPAVTPHREVSVDGSFGWNTPTTTHTRVHAEDRYASWAVSDPRVLERIQACTSEPAVRVVNASVHVTQSGVASHVQSDASDATTTCLQNALIGSVWPCSGERDVAMRLCVGDPVAPPEPVRP